MWLLALHLLLCDFQQVLGLTVWCQQHLAAPELQTPLLPFGCVHQFQSALSNLALQSASDRCITCVMQRHLHKTPSLVVPQRRTLHRSCIALLLHFSLSTRLIGSSYQPTAISYLQALRLFYRLQALRLFYTVHVARITHQKEKKC